MKDTDPLFWTLNDLRKPSPECVLPKPERHSDGRIGRWETCSHCGDTFLLIVAGSMFWVNAEDHKTMMNAEERYLEEMYPDAY